jgi:[protein-PII] uridylyltransferase
VVSTHSDTLVTTNVGAAAREARAAALDAWLASLLPAGPGVALVAVGGLGRRECAPRSDLDLVLIHSGQSDVDSTATGLWYRIWDARFALDHSVRTVEEALAVAGDDVKVALGLLDARLIAGDATLLARLQTGVLRRWRGEAQRLLPALGELTMRRWEAHGELAFLLEGDVKESRGGLRDHVVLRGIGFAGVADATRPAVRAAHRFLLDVRDGMHAVRGRRVDRLLAQDRAEVAKLLELAEGDELARRLAEAARTVAHACDDAWRAVDRWLVGRRNNGRTTTRPVRQADRPRDPRMARGIRCPAATAVAGSRPGRAADPARQRSGAGADLGGVRPVRPGHGVAAGMGTDP